MAGVEPNPGPDQPGDSGTAPGTAGTGTEMETVDRSLGTLTKTFEKMGSQATTEGQFFEVKLAALVFLRLHGSSAVSRFLIASNLKGAGALDDLVVRYHTVGDGARWKTCFVQQKYKKKVKISVGSFTTSKYFELKKYFKSFLDIKKMIEDGKGGEMFDCSFEDCRFMLYTNAEVDNFVRGRVRDFRSSEIDEVLRTGLKNELVFQLSEESDEDIFSFLRDDEESRKVFSESGTTFLAQGYEETCRAFFRSLTVFTGQALAEEADSVIKTELLAACDGKTKAEVDLVYPFYVEAFKCWWEASFDILHESSGILREACDRFLVKSLPFQQEKEFCLEMGFRDLSLLDVTPSDGVSLLHVTAPQSSTKLACTRVIQAMQKRAGSYLFLSLGNLLRETGAVMSAWVERPHTTLVIVSGLADEDPGKCNTLCETLKEGVEKKLKVRRDQQTKISKGSKKNRTPFVKTGATVPDQFNAFPLVVISHSNDPFTSALKTEFATQYREIEDVFQLAHLEQKSASKILEKEVQFQGRTIRLGDLLEGRTQLWPGVMSDDLVQQVLSGEPMTLGPTLSDDILYYISRKLEGDTVLRGGVLTERTQDVFVVSDICKQELQSLVLSGERVGLVGDPDSGQCRFLVAEPGSADAVSKVLQENKNKTVHEVRWLGGGRLRWTATQGSLGHITKFIDEERQMFNPTTALDLEGRVVLLVADPGMGKSTFVTHLAIETKNAHPTYWVVRVNIAAHMDLLESLPCNDGVAFLASALDIVKQSRTEQALFRLAMEQAGNCVIIVDGFDEIAPQFTEKGCDLLTSLLATKASKVLVTSRHSTQRRLQSRLSALPLTLRKFDADDQRRFFKAYWSTAGEPSSLSGSELDELVSKLIELIERSLHDGDKEFMGIPLQAMMVAEIYEDYYRDLATKNLPEKLDLLSLFEKVIDKKFQIYLKKVFPNNKNIATEMETLLPHVYKEHMQAALVLLLDEKTLLRLRKAKKIINSNLEFCEKVNNSKNKSGIVKDVKDGKPVFLHRTFMEFFAALWFSEHYEDNRVVLEETIFTAEFQVVRRIFDLLLAKNSELHRAVLNIDLLAVDALLSRENVDSVDDGGRSPLHLAAGLGFRFREGRLLGPEPQHVANLVVEYGPNLDVEDDVLGWTALRYAAATKSWDAVDLLLGAGADSKGVYIENEGLVVNKYGGADVKSTLVHQAAGAGHVHVVARLVGSCRDVVWERDQYGSTPLWDACRLGRLEAARALVASLGHDEAGARDYVAARNSFRSSAVHAAAKSEYADLVEFLVRSGADPRIRYDDDPLLFKACYLGWPGVVRALVKAVGPDEDVRRYVRSSGSAGETALHKAAIGGNASIVRLLVERGASPWVFSTKQKTPLHSASSHGQVEAVETLLASLRDDIAGRYVEEQDIKGHSSLHLAAMYGHSNVVECLISRGASIWTRNKRRRTPLFSACCFGKADAARTLIASLGTDRELVKKYVGAKDKDGDSPLHMAMGQRDPVILDLLVSNGGDPWALNKKGRTPLHLACEWGEQDTVLALVAKVGDDKSEYLKVRDGSGNWALHAAAEGGSLDVVNLLVARGCDPWAKNRRGETPLHVACSWSRERAAEALIASVGDEASRRKYVMAGDSEGNAALHNAAAATTTGPLDLLLAAGADPWTRNRRGETPLFGACFRDGVKAFQTLLACFTDDASALEYVSARDVDDNTPLHSAARGWGSNTLDLLVSRGGDRRACNKKGETPLHLACKWGRIRAVKALIAGLGDDSSAVIQFVNATNTAGQTAADMANETDDKSLCREKKNVTEWLQKKVQSLQ